MIWHGLIQKPSHQCHGSVVTWCDCKPDIGKCLPLRLRCKLQFWTSTGHPHFIIYPTLNSPSVGLAKHGLHWSPHELVPTAVLTQDVGWGSTFSTSGLKTVGCSPRIHLGSPRYIPGTPSPSWTSQLCGNRTGDQRRQAETASISNTWLDLLDLKVVNEEIIISDLKVVNEQSK